MALVREATEADYASQSLIDLLDTWILECNPDGLDFAPEAVIIRDTLQRLGQSPIGTTLVLVDEKDGYEKIVGCLGLVIHGWGASAVHNFVSENLWYLLPGYSGYATRIVGEARRWARERIPGNGRKYLLFSTNRLSSGRSQRSSTWLKRLGFRPLYSLFIREA